MTITFIRRQIVFVLLGVNVYAKSIIVWVNWYHTFSSMTSLIDLKIILLTFLANIEHNY